MFGSTRDGIVTFAGLRRIVLLTATANAGVTLGTIAWSGGGGVLLAGTLLGTAALAWLGLRGVAGAERAHGQALRSNDALAAMSRQDGLLGIANRRALDEALEREWARSARSGESLALLLIDVDHFKKFNDLHGHIEGDECLRRCAAALGRALRRPGDLLARFGGEEFAMLLPDTDLAGAEHVARAVHDALAAANIRHGHSGHGRVTVSIGAAACQPRHTRGVADLLSGADAALYRAKRQGRNRTVCDHPDSPVVVPLRPALGRA